MGLVITHKLLKILSFVFYLATPFIAILWLRHPDGSSYEPLIVLFGSSLVGIEYFKRSTKDINRIGVSHIVPNENTWKIGLKGFFVQTRGVVFVMIIMLIFLLVVTVRKENIITMDKIKIDISLVYLAYIVIITFTLLYIILSKYIKYRSVRSLRMKSKLHQLVHMSRDETCDLYKRTNNIISMKNNVINIEHEKKHLYDFSEKACNIIKEYLVTVTGDKCISCVIRVASYVPESEQIGYVTVGRSSNLNKSRYVTTEPIFRNEGAPKFFSNHKTPNQGILFYYNLDLAIKNGAYKKTVNSQQYDKEIKKIIVAPINGWTGNKIDLIGLLYINSTKSKILNPKYAELVAFASDALAITYTSMFARLHYVNLKQLTPSGSSNEHN